MRSTRTGPRGVALVLGALACLTACGGGGGSTGGTGGNGVDPALLGFLQLVGTSPANDAIQVELRPEIQVRFDAAVETGALTTREFSLCVRGTTEPVPGAFSTKDNGRTVLFVPHADLQKATDYELVVAPTVVDTSFRATDREHRLRFRTFDDVPPRVTSASVTANQTGVSRTGTLVVQFDESLDAASVARAIALRDPWATPYDVEVSHQEGAVYITPAHDLPGYATFVLSVRSGASGVEDRAGNALQQDWSVRFTTAGDSKAPVLLSSEPAHDATGISPRARISLRFDESVDDDSFDPSGLLLQDAYLNAVPFAIGASRDHRRIHILPEDPLAPNAEYRITVRSGPTGLADFSGNAIASEQVLRFHTGTDEDAPYVVRTSPASEAVAVSPNVVFDLDFDGPLAPASVSRDTVTLSSGTSAIYITPALTLDATRLTVIPSQLLAPSTTYTLRLLSGFDGVRDAAGNPLENDVVLRFTTSASGVLPEFVITPGHGTYGVPNTSKLTIIANAPLDPATVSASTVLVVDSVTGPVPGTISVGRGHRVIEFVPTVGFTSGATITCTVRGEIGGVHLASGNWPTRDVSAMFSIGFSGDSLAPELELTLNGIARTRKDGLVLPPSGFTIDCTLRDVGNWTVDPASLELVLSGPGSVPSSDELFALGSFTSSSAQILVDPGIALDPGHYELRASVQDLSGNQSPLASLQFEVTAAGSELRPFERMQIVWVRFDMDREGRGQGNGTPDFDEDLIDYGLMAAGDPQGTNTRMRELVRDGILRQAHRLYHRADTGAPITGSVPIRLVLREPSTAPHMRIAVGGKDPGGAPNRVYGNDSSGILGRAYYDYRNGSPNENNTGTSPGLGVFGGELFLYQSRLHLDLYPYYLTTFARTFKSLCPHMGGTPAGSDPLDGVVLAPSFDYANATAAQKARHDTVMSAADDLATALGTILAHEIGHSLGLTAPGVCPHGLHGDSSLHNSATSFTDVMSAVISYESLVTVDFVFRPLNLAYLRERILTR